MIKTIKVGLGIVLASVFLGLSACSSNDVLAVYRDAEVKEELSKEEFTSVLAKIDSEEGKKLFKMHYQLDKDKGKYVHVVKNPEVVKKFYKVLVDNNIWNPVKMDITRGEFYDFLGPNRKRATSQKRAFKSYLARFAFRKYILDRGAEEKFQETDTYKEKMQDYIQEKVLKSLFVSHYFPSLRKEVEEFSVPACKMQEIIVRVKKQKKVFDPARYQQERARIMKQKNAAKRQEMLVNLQRRRDSITKSVPLSENQIEQNREEAKQTIDEAYEKLQSGTDFAKVAEEYSEHASAGKGGAAGYVLYYQRNKPLEYQKAMLALEEKAYSEPFRVKDKWYIIRCLEKTKMTDENYKKLFPDKRKSRFALSMAKSSLTRSFVEEVKTNDKHVHLHKDRLSSDDTNTTVFSIDHPEYQVEVSLGEYLEKLKQYFRRVKRKNQSEFSEQERKDFYDEFVQEQILRYGPFKTGLYNESEFQDALDEKREENKWQIYLEIMKDKRKEQFTVTDKEVEEEFARYEKKIASQKKKPKKVYTFEEAAPLIKPWLKRRKEQQFTSSLQRRVMQRLEYKEDNFDIEKPKKPKKRAPRKKPGQNKRGQQKKNK